MAVAFASTGGEDQSKSIVVHPLADLSSAYPPVFVYDLKKNFIHGKGKSTEKFHAIRKQIIQALPTAALPGPATFVVRCLEALSLIEAPYNEGLSHILTSAMNRICFEDREPEDSLQARELATVLFISTLKGAKNIEGRIAVKVAEIFDVRLSNVEDALGCQEQDRSQRAETLVGAFVLNLIKGQSFKSAMSAIEHFHLCQYASRDFLVTMVASGEHRLAGQWAHHLGKDTVCTLVQFCLDSGMYELAYSYVQHYQLNKVFPRARYLYRCSIAPKLVVEGHNIERYSSPIQNRGSMNPGHDQKPIAKVFELQAPRDERKCFLQLTDVISADTIVWVASLKELALATCHCNEAREVGIDTEWKLNRAKGSHPNKVAILQIATSKLVFVFDLISLSSQHKEALNHCIRSIFHSKNVLKLGYAVHNDLERLLESYDDMDCFHTCESILDLQQVAGKGIKGGLSGLAKLVLGQYMDKRTRLSDWECRPLSTEQLHYAALDVAVLLPIFDYLKAVGERLAPAGRAMSSKDIQNWTKHGMLSPPVHSLSS